MIKIIEITERKSGTWYHVMYNDYVMHEGKQLPKNVTFETWCQNVDQAQSRIKYQARRYMGLPDNEYVFINTKRLIEVFGK